VQNITQTYDACIHDNILKKFALVMPTSTVVQILESIKFRHVSIFLLVFSRIGILMHDISNRKYLGILMYAYIDP